jgi:enoyl-CoA hydratase/carnithine racemase
MNIIRKSISSLLNKNIFKLCESKIENKIGFIYMNSPKDLNALSNDMKKSLVSSIKQF